MTDANSAYKGTLLWTSLRWAVFQTIDLRRSAYLLSASIAELLRYSMPQASNLESWPTIIASDQSVPITDIKIVRRIGNALCWCLHAFQQWCLNCEPSPSLKSGSGYRGSDDFDAVGIPSIEELHIVDCKLGKIYLS